MTRTMRTSATAAALLLVALLTFAIPTLWGKPWSIDHFFARVFLDFALDRPLLLSQLRILEPYGLDFHSDDLGDFSVEFEREEIRELEQALEVLRRYERDALDPEQQRSRDVLEWFLEVEVAGAPFRFHDYPVNQMDGIQTGLVDFMINVHQVNGPRDAENYRMRLLRFGPAIDQIIEALEYRREIGVVPPRFVLLRVREELAELLAPPPAEHVLSRHFERALSELEAVSTEERAALLAGVVAAVADDVNPAYRRLDAELASLEAVASDDAGVWKLPDGAAYYAWLLRRHTTTRLSADEIHALGLAEVERIGGELRAVLAELGIDAPDLLAALERVAEDPRFAYPPDEAGRAAILGDYQAIIDDARARLPGLFGRLPRAQVTVERVPAFLQKGAPLAYYQPPPFDASRPGTFYVNLRNVAEQRRYRMRTLAYHEAIPGHHLQVALAMELEDVPFFRRVLPFTAYSEGWALYAERLAGEQGFLPTPADRLGMLVDEMFRAVRLVVDTGIHARRWTRLEAIQYMRANTGKPLSEVIAEIERYIVMPGQATAYKIGQLELLGFRERARRELGDDFDLRAFHDLVLGAGALPLEILGHEVDAFVAGRRGGAER